MNDATLVHVLDGGHQLGGVKPGTVGGVRGLVVGRQAVDESQQVSVLGVRYDKVEANSVLKIRIEVSNNKKIRSSSCC